VADETCRPTRHAGFSVWQDCSHIRGGEDFRHQIEEAIGGCQFLVMVLTADASSRRPRGAARRVQARPPVVTIRCSFQNESPQSLHKCAVVDAFPRSDCMAEDSFEQALADLRAYVEAQVRGGFMPVGEIPEAAVEYLSDDAAPDALRPYAEAFTAEALVAHSEDENTWPAVTDCDRLDAAFAALEGSGVLAPGLLVLPELRSRRDPAGGRGGTQ
jgi:hypothetical protein